MRVSTAMMNQSKVRMEGSSVYKSYFKNKTEKTNDGESNKDGAVNLGSGLAVKKNEDKIVVTHTSGENKGEVLKAYDIESELGKELNQFIQSKQLKSDEALTSKTDEVNSAILSMKSNSLLDYI